MKEENIHQLAKKRILILDGATGTEIQSYHLPEKNYDFLSVSHPEIIRNIHRSYIKAGADIITTNTFNSNALSQHQYGHEGDVYRLNHTGARLAAEVAAQCKERKIYVAGSIGPTAFSLSLTPEGFNRLETTYEEQVKGLIDGGADLLLVETVYDSRNAEAALEAILKVGQEKGVSLPIMLSATINKCDGKIFSGESLHSLYEKFRHYGLTGFGINCSYGAQNLLPYVEQAAKDVECLFCVYPNAGLPDAHGRYEENPEVFSECLTEMAHNGLLNIAGGCCGTTPEHIKTLQQALYKINPRKIKLFS